MKTKIINITICILIGIFVILFPVISGIIVGITKMEGASILFLQAFFMLLPIIIFIILILLKKINGKDIRLVTNVNKKNYLYYLPVVLVYIPVLIGGFVWKGSAYFFGNLLLYLAVGIAEELYFRGIIPHLLEKDFKKEPVILISSLIFGLGHAASAFANNNPIVVVLTILNALIFGFLAICLLYKTKTIVPLMIIHFLFDFETKFIALEGNDLSIAEGVRGSIMLIYAIILFVLIRKTSKSEVMGN
ncbi:MAG: CPBP family intramembrane metalloprotease [Acholeplasmatales bacterium]|nr:CPBP family intramembrane metalloprotease [Acholeplasmatales bacterium]